MNKQNGTIEKSPREGKSIRVWQDGKAFDFGTAPKNKKAWYAQHEKDLKGNSPRAKAFNQYAKSIFQDGGEYSKYQNGGECGGVGQPPCEEGFFDSMMGGVENAYESWKDKEWFETDKNIVKSLVPGTPYPNPNPYYYNEKINPYLKNQGNVDPDFMATGNPNMLQEQYNLGVAPAEHVVSKRVNRVPNTQQIIGEQVQNVDPDFMATGNPNMLQEQYNLGVKPATKTDMGEGYTSGQIGDAKKEQGDKDKENKYEEFNPYAGVDIPSAANFLGESIESGNALGIAAGGLKTGLGVARNVLGGMGLERTQRRGEENFRETGKENTEGRTRNMLIGEDGGYYLDGGVTPMEYYKDGGEIPQEKLMTGEVMQGVSENNQGVQPNAELEDGEHIQSQDGGSIKVEGKDHEEGGEKVELKEGDRVISNNLEIGSKGKKQLQDMFDVKLSSKDTYAKAVDKAYNSIGLSKVIKEEEKVLKKLTELQEKVKDETTKDLNSEFLYKKLEDIQAKKDELEPKRQEVLTSIFSLQEESKPKQEPTEEQKFEDGGVMMLSEKYGIPKERAFELLEEFKKGGYKKYEEGGKFTFNVNDTNYDVSITNDEDAKLAQMYIEVIDEMRKNSKVGSNVKDLDGRYSQAVSKLEEIVKKYDSKVDIQQALAGKQEVPGGGEGKKTSIGNQVYGQNNANAIYKMIFNKQPKVDGTPPPKKDTQGKTIPTVALLPDQGVLPPSGMASQLNVQRRFDTVEPNLLSAEQMIAENQRQAQTAMGAAQDLPDSQRAATIGQINANLQEANNKAIFQVESQNSQIKNQTAAQNAQIQMSEENANAQDSLSYEQRQQTAQALTEENVRQYYDYLRKLNTSNFNDIRRRKSINQMYENFDIDAQGNVANKGGVQFTVNEAMAKGNYALAEKLLKEKTKNA